MRILQVLFTGLGGHAAVASSFVRGDRHRRHEHLALLYGVEPVAEGNRRLFETLGVPVTAIVKRRGEQPWLRVHSELEALRPDAIVLHSVSLVVPVALFGRRHRVPVLCVEHTANQAKRASDWAISAACAVLADGVVYLTERYRSEVAEKLGPLARHDATVVGNGVDLDAFRPSTRSAHARIRIGMLGRFVPVRDHATLVRAVAALRASGHSPQLVLAGDGETRSAIEMLARGLDLGPDDCEFPGTVAPEAVPELLRSLDVYVQSTRAETMSTAIMQAMATALPVISTDVVGTRTMISHGETGVLVAEDDVGGLAAAIARIADEPALARKLGDAARAHALARWSESSMFEAYERRIEALAASKHGRE